MTATFARRCWTRIGAGASLSFMVLAVLRAHVPVASAERIALREDAYADCPDARVRARDVMGREPDTIAAFVSSVRREVEQRDVAAIVRRVRLPTYMFYEENGEAQLRRIRDRRTLARTIRALLESSWRARILAETTPCNLRFETDQGVYVAGAYIIDELHFPRLEISGFDRDGRQLLGE